MNTFPYDFILNSSTHAAKHIPPRLEEDVVIFTLN